VELGAELIAFLMLAANVAGMLDAVAGGGGMITIPALLATGVPPVSRSPRISCYLPSALQAR
jgi:uncharacterized membrane protein YfcA